MVSFYITMLSTKISERQSEELNGKINSSLNYSKQTIVNKRTTEERKTGFKNILDHMRYYQSKQCDPEFMAFVIEYHMEQSVKNAVRPKTVLTSDKVRSDIAVEEIRVLDRLWDCLN